MKKICLLLSFVFFLAYFGCSKDEESPTEPSSEIEAQQVYDEVVKPQEDNYNLLTDLFTQMDTVLAMDSVLKVFIKDPNVDWGEVGDQGIAIQYNNGIRGGIFINPKDGLNGNSAKFNNFGKKSADVGQLLQGVPDSKKTVFLSAVYGGVYKEFADHIIENYNDRLPTAGYQKPDIYLAEQVDIERFTKLSDYGIIHIETHGMPWPSLDNIDEVYIMTGESWTSQTYNKYKADINSGEIPLIRSESTNGVFWLSSDFIAKHNDFSANRSLIFGGFCCSYLGHWPETIIHTAGAGGYFGYDWAVWAGKDMRWCLDLFMDLTDMSKVPPLTTGDWMNNEVQKWYWNSTDNRAIYIKYLGDPDLALIESKLEVDLSQINELSCDVYPTIDWSCGDSRPNVNVHKIRQPVNISGYTFELEWDEMRTFTGSVDVQDIGELRIKFDSTFTKIENYYATNTYYYQADSAKLAQYGYPNTKTQTYSGQNLPIWVNEPSQSRYIYGVSGLEASNYLDILECKYNFPDGTTCSINDYEFTDDVLQMIRFDFHIK